MNEWELTDDEIKKAIIEADKEIWAYESHPRWEGDEIFNESRPKEIGRMV